MYIFSEKCILCNIQYGQNILNVSPTFQRDQQYCNTLLSDMFEDGLLGTTFSNLI
jgi:hypothetical protein